MLLALLHDRHSQRVAAGRVVHDIGVQLRALREAWVERDAEPQRLLELGHRLKGHDLAPESERVEGKPPPARRGAATPRRLVPPKGELWFGHERGGHLVHVVVQRVVGEGEAGLRVGAHSVQHLPARRAPPGRRVRTRWAAVALAPATGSRAHARVLLLAAALGPRRRAALWQREEQRGAEQLPAGRSEL
eukprot:scaffold32124_cov77-Phaeocystis_antarctica.AAC.5